MTHSPILNGHIRAGAWHGEMASDNDVGAPDVAVTHNGTVIAGVTVKLVKDRGCWQITVPIPPAAINDGLQTFVLTDGRDTTLGQFSILAGDSVPDDLRAEVSLLRAELDLLKASFRKHCLKG